MDAQGDQLLWDLNAEEDEEEKEKEKEGEGGRWVGAGEVRRR